MRRDPIDIAAIKASAEMIAGDRITIKFETHEGLVTATLPAKVAQRLQAEIGMLLEPKKVHRAWGVGLNTEPALTSEDEKPLVITEFDPAGLGRASK